MKPALELFSKYNIDHEIGIDWNTLRKWRMERVKECMKKSDLDAAFIGRQDNVRYFVSYKGQYGTLFWTNWKQVVFLPKDGDPILFVPGYHVDSRRLTMPWLKPENIRAGPWTLDYAVNADYAVRKLFAPLLKEYGVTKGKVGFDVAPVNMLLAFQRAMPEIEIASALEMISEAEMIKHDEEIKCMKISSDIAAIGHRAVFDHLRQGMTERDVQNTWLKAVLDAGAEAVRDCDTWCNSGDNLNPLRQTVTDKMIREGDAVVWDLTMSWNGYYADLTRCKVVGKYSPEQKRTYMTAHDALLAAIKATKPGVDVSVPDLAARKVVRDAGFDLKKHYIHCLGHSIGIHTHQPPAVCAMDPAYEDLPWPKVALQKNMVLAYEPPIFNVPGVGGFREEDEVLITDTGCEVLSKSSPYWADMI